MNISFDNMGGIHLNQDAFAEIQKICADHPACENCPVLEQGAIQNTADKTIYSCSKAIINNMQRAKNGKV